MFEVETFVQPGPGDIKEEGRAAQGEVTELDRFHRRIKEIDDMLNNLEGQCCEAHPSNLFLSGRVAVGAAACENLEIIPWIATVIRRALPFYRKLPSCFVQVFGSTGQLSAKSDPRLKPGSRSRHAGVPNSQACLTPAFLSPILYHLEAARRAQRHQPLSQDRSVPRSATVHTREN